MDKEFQIKNRKGETFTVVVDDEHYDLVVQHKWFIQQCRGRKPYVATGIVRNGKHVLIRLHQFLMQPAPCGQVVDHVNNSGLDNRCENLRFCTPAENNGFKRAQGVFDKPLKMVRGGAYRTIVRVPSKASPAKHRNIVHAPNRKNSRVAENGLPSGAFMNRPFADPDWSLVDKYIQQNKIE